MYRSFLLVVFIVTMAVPVLAQTDSVVSPPIADTVVVRDTTAVAPRVVRPPVQQADTVVSVVTPLPWSDSVSLRPVVRDTWTVDDHLPLFIQVLRKHPYFNFTAKPLAYHYEVRKVQGKEIVFYVLMGLILLFALIKEAFNKYFNDLFRVLFRTTLKKRQIREQLMQTPLPSLIFNGFYVASAGLYANFMLHYFEIAPVKNFWLLYLYCCTGLAVIYIGKFIGLKIFGWLFNMKKAADSYIFIVFIINKVIGIFLLPFLLFLAFANDPIYSISLVLSWCGIGALFLYRFILGFAAIRNEVRFNLFHFFLYLCAFEITPLLLIYKLLLLVFK